MAVALARADLLRAAIVRGDCPFRKFHPAWIRIVRQNHHIIETDEVVDSYPTPMPAFERLQAKVEELRKTEPTLTKV